MIPFFDLVESADDLLGLAQNISSARFGAGSQTRFHPYAVESPSQLPFYLPYRPSTSSHCPWYCDFLEPCCLQYCRMVSYQAYRRTLQCVPN